MKIVRSSVAHMHNTWTELSEFEKLTDEQKACISEIDSKIEPKTVMLADGSSKIIKVEYVRIRLYDKQKSLDSISKLMGYDAPVKTELSNPDGSLKNQIRVSIDALFPEAQKE